MDDNGSSVTGRPEIHVSLDLVVLQLIGGSPEVLLEGGEGLILSFLGSLPGTLLGNLLRISPKCLIWVGWATSVYQEEQFESISFESVTHSLFSYSIENISAQ